MKVIVRAEFIKSPKVKGWLTPKREYPVLAVEMMEGSSFYRIESDDNATPVLFPSKLFRIVDRSLPRTWVIAQEDDRHVQMMPAPWLEDGYWERFFDCDPAAREIYRTVRDSVVRNDEFPVDE